MTVLSIPKGRPALATERRTRVAALLGLLIFLALTAFAAIGLGSQSKGAATVDVVTATRDIRPGTTITADELGTAKVRIDDATLLATLVRASDSSRLVGQTAAVGVSAGHLVPDNLVAPQVSANLWEANIPVKRLPSDLRAGDHVALLVNGTTPAGAPLDYIVMQDVEVISVASGNVDLWLPPKLVAQIEFYADHGGIVLVKMQPGSVQQNLAPGSGT